MKSNILITGATGNVGFPTILHLVRQNLRVRAGVRKPARSADRFKNFSEKLDLIPFDFAAPQTFAAALQGIETVFLLRPPQLADTDKYFRPFIEACQAHQVKHIVFLSVQGAGKNKVIPHHKIEKLLEESSLNYTFLRPSYFMQNFLMDLHEDLVRRKEIILPAGKAKFNLIDVEDIARVAAIILLNPEAYQQQALDLTGNENLTFGQMSRILSDELGEPITFSSLNPFAFFFYKKRKRVPAMKILVMIMLHFLPRFSKEEPAISNNVEKIKGQRATTFRQFVKRNKELLLN